MATQSVDVNFKGSLVSIYAQYSGARLGLDYVDDDPDPKLGQGYGGGVYWVWQAGLLFDLTEIPESAYLDSAVFRTGYESGEMYNKGGWDIGVYKAGWGTYYTPADFIPGNSSYLGSSYRLATEDTATFSNPDTLYSLTNYSTNLMDEIADPNDRGAALQTVWISEEQRLGSSPSGWEYMEFWKDGATHQTELYVTYTSHSLTRTISIGAQPYYSSQSGTVVALSSIGMQSRFRMRPNVAQIFYGNVRAYDASGAFKGILPGTIILTEKLDGANTIELVTPWRYQDGKTREELITEGWFLEYNSAWFIIQDYERDKDTNSIRVAGVSSETGLERFLTNYSSAPLSMPSHTPTEIMDAVLGGQPECEWYNGSFTDLESNGFPVGWTATTGTWAAFTGQGGPGIAATAFEDGDAELESWAINHVAGSEIKLVCDVWVESGFNGTIDAVLSWRNAAGTETASHTLELDYSGGSWVTTTDSAFRSVLNERCVLKLLVGDNTSEYEVRFRAIRFVQDEDDTGWNYYGTMDSRSASIPYTSSAIQTFGSWTRSGTVYSTTVDDTLALIFTGSAITVHFAAGGASATAKILVDGSVETAGYDVSAAVDYTIDGLNPHRSHVLEVIVQSVKVSISSFDQTAENRIAVTWNRMTVYQALRELQALVGGEFEFATAEHIIYHDLSQGIDLTSSNTLWLREGPQGNLISFVPETQTTEVKNRGYGGYYGDGHFQIAVRLDSVGEDDEANTSQDLFGVQRFTYTNKDIKDWASAIADASVVVEKDAFPKQTYRATVLSEDIVGIHCGDTVLTFHELLESSPQSLRVLEISKSSESPEATLLLGERPIFNDPAFQSESLRRQIEQLQRKY